MRLPSVIFDEPKVDGIQAICYSEGIIVPELILILCLIPHEKSIDKIGG